MTINIDKCYKILNVTNTSTNDEITKAFKKLAIKLHPDKNRDRIEWATEEMTVLNTAYSFLMSYRFSNENNFQKIKKTEKSTVQKQKQNKKRNSEEEREILIQNFIKLRENSKDCLYRFFQYTLYNIPRRESHSNMAVYNGIVHKLKNFYHEIKKMAQLSDDQELIIHFEIFSSMIFNFYKAAECLNIIDSYNNQTEVNAYRLYKKGDDILHISHKEIFFDRHNRGNFLREKAYSHLIQSIRTFKNALQSYPESTWSVETGIKLEYADSLRKYFELFFTEE